MSELHCRPASGPLDRLWRAGVRRGRAAPCGEPPAADAALVLADGRAVRVRPVEAADADALGRFIQALSPQTRRLRFHGAVNMLPPPVLQAMAQPDPAREVAWVATTLEAPQRLVADARYVVDAARGTAEFAVVVDDGWQGRGLGQAMLRQLAAHARERGLQQLHGDVLAGNHRMLALMERLGARLRADALDGSVMHADWGMPAPAQRRWLA